MTPAHPHALQAPDANEARECTVCHNFFEVPQGYGDKATWTCARCSTFKPPCLHPLYVAGKCTACGAIRMV